MSGDDIAQEALERRAESDARHRGPTGGEQTPPFGASSLRGALHVPLADLGRFLDQRIVIGGVPSAGKTTLCNSIGLAGAELVRHTDDLIESHGWSEVSQEISDNWLTAPGPWVIEGVATIRALRKWLKAHDEGKPCDVLIWLGTPIEPLEGRRLGLAKGCHTVFDEIDDELAARGVEIVRVFG